MCRGRSKKVKILFINMNQEIISCVCRFVIMKLIEDWYMEVYKYLKFINKKKCYKSIKK